MRVRRESWEAVKPGGAAGTRDNDERPTAPLSRPTLHQTPDSHRAQRRVTYTWRALAGTGRAEPAVGTGKRRPVATRAGRTHVPAHTTHTHRDDTTNVQLMRKWRGRGRTQRGTIQWPHPHPRHKRSALGTAALAQTRSQRGTRSLTRTDRCS